jgi:hypothetical protein
MVKGLECSKKDKRHYLIIAKGDMGILCLVTTEPFAHNG